MKRKSKLCALTGFLLLGTLSVGFLSGCDTEVPPIVEFDGYSVNLTFDNTKGNVTASKTSGSQSEEVTITVTAEDESTTVYTLTVNKTDETKDVGPVLSKLEISGATLSPTFSPEVYSYSVNVPIGTTTFNANGEYVKLVS